MLNLTLCWVKIDATFVKKSGEHKNYLKHKRSNIFRSRNYNSDNGLTISTAMSSSFISRDDVVDDVVHFARNVEIWEMRVVVEELTELF